MWASSPSVSPALVGVGALYFCCKCYSAHVQNNFSGCILKLSLGYQDPFNSTSLCHVDYLFSMRRKSLREMIFGVKIYMYSFLCLLTSGEVISPNLCKIRYRSWQMLVLPVLCTVFFLSPRWAMPSRFSCRWLLPWRVLSNGE